MIARRRSTARKSSHSQFSAPPFWYSITRVSKKFSSGFAFTENAWVQSYGSRYVTRPILFGNVSRPKPITVEWWQYAQSLAKRPMKAM